MKTLVTVLIVRAARSPVIESIAKSITNDA
jgi:hypothetical protein